MSRRKAIQIEISPTWRTLQGIETATTVCKRQIRLLPKGDIARQVAFISRLFGSSKTVWQATLDSLSLYFSNTGPTTSPCCSQVFFEVRPLSDIGRKCGGPLD